MSASEEQVNCSFNLQKSAIFKNVKKKNTKNPRKQRHQKPIKQTKTPHKQRFAKEAVDFGAIHKMQAIAHNATKH